MKNYIQHHPWQIIEASFDPNLHQISESLFSIGNGRMGQRANFAETYSGKHLAGTYLAGIYYPDKTRVGWWKNGYPEYFAKVLNAPNWLGLTISIDDQRVDMAKWKIDSFSRILNMEEGILERRSILKNERGVEVEISSRRFYHEINKDLALLEYSIKVLKGSPKIEFASAIDGDVYNEDSNYGEQFWENYQTQSFGEIGTLSASTKKTQFRVQYAMKNHLTCNQVEVTRFQMQLDQKAVTQKWYVDGQPGDIVKLQKFVCITSNFYYQEHELISVCRDQLKLAVERGFQTLFNEHRKAWSQKWSKSDVCIEGDIGAQQGIRFNIFQLLQTYSGDDPRLNIGPKGFTGEKYGGSTYWDTEAYCLPFYLATCPPAVPRNLLKYRYNHLAKAIENATLLGFSDGAALYPMVTMTGEECHNEWEITFEEIHRNGAIAYAIYDYINYTGDVSYLWDGGLEVLVGIARFWRQRFHFSEPKQQFVMHGVTGPNEYENNVNNNWYSNYIARWCLRYAAEKAEKMIFGKERALPVELQKLSVTLDEIHGWTSLANNIFLPEDEERNIFLQQEGFLDKEIKSVDHIPENQRPINQHWSWDRILRSCYIKQADVLQGLYFFEQDFTTQTIASNFNFYEPLTVHESSLSPCVHAILACTIKKYDKAYEMYLRTARLDLDDYNNDTEDGCHITSMAGTWLAIVKGFSGLRVRDDTLSLHPYCPKKWSSFQYHFKFRDRDLEIKITQDEVRIFNTGKKLDIMVYDQGVHLPEAGVATIKGNYNSL